MRDRPVAVAVAGVKNSGKTTLITGMLPHLAARGLRVAVIKHDGHCFAPAPPGTDTGRYLQAGAWGCAIFDGEKSQATWRGKADEAALLGQFPGADIVLLEGFKHSRWPKLELIRAANAAGPLCDPATLLALVTDLPIALPGVPTIPFGDAGKAAGVVLRHWQGGPGIA